jgi:hypothetical protein
MRMVLAVVAILGVNLASATACGGDGDSDEASSALAIEPDAQGRAESIVLKLSDFPNGWRGSPPEEQEDPGAFRKCIGADYSDLTRIGDAESQDFAKGDSAEVTSTASIFKDEEEAADALSRYSKGMNSAAAEDCFQDLIEDAVRKESTGKDAFKIGEVDIGQVNVKQPPGVEESATWQIVIPVEITSGFGEGLSPDLYLERVLMREGDAIGTVTTQDTFEELDPALRDKLAAAQAGRMSAQSTSE